MPKKNNEYSTYAAEPMAEVPEMKELIETKMNEMNAGNNLVPSEVPVVETKPYSIDKITRSCDRSISVNYQTYKVSTILSATVKDPEATPEQINAISKEIYSMAEAQTLEEINRIKTALGR